MTSRRSGRRWRWRSARASSCGRGETSAIRYYDTSAILPLYLDEPATGAAQAALARDFGQLVTSALTLVELRSGLARLQRDGVLSVPQAGLVFARVRRDLGHSPRRLDLSHDVLTGAARLIASNVALSVRTLDALHIATCLRYGTGSLVTNDKQQAQFAAAVGLDVHWLGGDLGARRSGG